MNLLQIYKLFWKPPQGYLKNQDRKKRKFVWCLSTIEVENNDNGIKKKEKTIRGYVDIYFDSFIRCWNVNRLPDVYGNFLQFFVESHFVCRTWISIPIVDEKLIESSEY